MHIFICSVVHILRQCIFECLLFTDNRVTGRVCTYLKGRFRSLEAAEKTYNLTLSDALAELTVGHPKQRRNNNAVQLQQQSATNPHQNPPVVACQCSLLSIKFFQILQDLPSLDAVKLEKIADASFLELALRAGIDTNPGNFASLSAKAIKLLQSQGKTNLVYRFAYVIATARPESDESLLPLN